MTQLQMLRVRGVLQLTAFGWGCTLSLMLLTLVFDFRNEATGVLLSAAINLLPSFYAGKQRYDLQVGTAFGIMAAVQPALLIYVMSGHPWQMEGHMYFFVGLAALMLLCDWRPIAAASAVISVHHLLLGYVAPEWVFIGSGDLARVLVHALAVGLVLAMLGPTARDMAKLFVERADARQASDSFADAARRAKDEAESALAAANTAQAATEERQFRLEAEREAHAAARSKELLAFAETFEGSVAQIVGAVSATAGQLEQAARQMHHFAQNTGQHTANVAAEAKTASSNVLVLSAGVTELARAISGIAVTADQQGELGHSSQSGEQAIQTLATRTANIEALVSLIQGVSSQTNLLAINATIEAARAGNKGRGFAVVPSEVKLLARKAQEAAGDITSLVANVGEGANEASGAIAEVAKAMQQLVRSAENMRNAIRQQHDVARAIESNAIDSAASTDAMAKRVEQVAKSAAEAADLSREVQGSADGLAPLAGNLQSAADRFLLHLRAA